jgi:hypothetical protein
MDIVTRIELPDVLIMDGADDLTNVTRHLYKSAGAPPAGKERTERKAEETDVAATAPTALPQADEMIEEILSFIAANTSVDDDETTPLIEHEVVRDTALRMVA